MIALALPATLTLLGVALSLWFVALLGVATTRRRIRRRGRSSRPDRAS